MTHDWHISYPVLGLLLGTVLVLAFVIWWCRCSKKRSEEADRIIRNDIMNTTYVPLDMPESKSWYLDSDNESEV